MTKRESTLDEKIAAALADDADVSVETLYGLIDEADKAAKSAKELAAASRERAVDPRILDSSALASAIENETHYEKLKNAYQLLVAKLQKTQRIAAHTVWLAQADKVTAEVEAVAKEFTDTYNTFVSAFIAIAARVQSVNAAARG
jgi:soluble cytochrome b562